jgi:hypothetical protein
MTSHASDDIDFLYTILGSTWARDTLKIAQLNMCSYYLKV